MAGKYWYDIGYGALAQLGERLHGMQEVSGSIPLGSTSLLATTGIFRKPRNSGGFLFLQRMTELETRARGLANRLVEEASHEALQENCGEGRIESRAAASQIAGPNFGKCADRYQAEVLDQRSVTEKTRLKHKAQLARIVGHFGRDARTLKGFFVCPGLWSALGRDGPPCED